MKYKRKKKSGHTSEVSPLVLLVFIVPSALMVVLISFSEWNNPFERTDLTVYRKPSCQCCMRWVDHLRESGLNVKVVNVDTTKTKQDEVGLPASLSACHTAIMGNYVIEGHVPADLVHNLIQERPNILGLAVPGMPRGSPGMEAPDPQKYDVIMFDRSGNSRVIATRLGKTKS